jgi:flagellar L-ring protein precursor FlgH
MKHLIWILILFTSCASYVNSLHRQIDNEEKSKKSRVGKRKFRNPNDQRPIGNPRTLNGEPSRNRPPGVERNYNSRAKKRYKAEDLLDNTGDGSLWSGKNSSNFLFVTNKLKRAGDIVIVEVLSKLKDQIQGELKRTFPDRPTRTKKTKKGAKTPDEKPKEEVPKAANTDDPSKVHDKISTKVIEVVNKDYLLVRGRKEVIFKESKRYFEFQAIVSQKDISSGDAVKSNKLLEPRVNVLRY